MSVAVDRFSEPVAFHGEGPVWSDAAESSWCVADASGTWECEVVDSSSNGTPVTTGVSPMALLDPEFHLREDLKGKLCAAGAADIDLDFDAVAAERRAPTTVSVPVRCTAPCVRRARGDGDPCPRIADVSAPGSAGSDRCRRTSSESAPFDVLKTPA